MVAQSHFALILLLLLSLTKEETAAENGHLSTSHPKGVAVPRGNGYNLYPGSRAGHHLRSPESQTQHKGDFETNSAYSPELLSPYSSQSEVKYSQSQVDDSVTQQYHSLDMAESKYSQSQESSMGDLLINSPTGTDSPNIPPANNNFELSSKSRPQSHEDLGVSDTMRQTDTGVDHPDISSQLEQRTNKYQNNSSNAITEIRNNITEENNIVLGDFSAKLFPSVYIELENVTEDYKVFEQVESENVNDIRTDDGYLESQIYDETTKVSNKVQPLNVETSNSGGDGLDKIANPIQLEDYHNHQLSKEHGLTEYSLPAHDLFESYDSIRNGYNSQPVDSRCHIQEDDDFYLDYSSYSGGEVYYDYPSYPESSCSAVPCYMENIVIDFTTEEDIHNNNSTLTSRGQLTESKYKVTCNSYSNLTGMNLDMTEACKYSTTHL